MRIFLLLCGLGLATQALAQPSSQPAKKPRYAYWSAAGYVALNAGLFYGAHTLHAVRNPEEAEHAVYDAAIADVLSLGGLSLLGTGYVLRQKELGEDVVAPRLFYRTAALSGASTTLFWLLSRSLEQTEPDIAARSKFSATLSFSFCVGSLTTALALRSQER